MSSAAAAVPLSRRQFLALLPFGWFGWFPFFRPKYITLGGARFRIIRRGHSKRHYLVIHGDEETARQVLLNFMDTHQGVAFVIESHTRNVRIGAAELDPNRMFSREGAELNLKTQNPDLGYPKVEDALSALDRGRDRFVKALLPPRGGLLVALHNNSEEYSLQDEAPISDAVSLKQPGDPHAFFLCTSAADFKVLSTSPYNALLQKDKPRQDDGSLSRLAARSGVRYVNLEVRNGDAAAQIEMLLWLDRNLV